MEAHEEPGEPPGAPSAAALEALYALDGGSTTGVPAAWSPTGPNRVITDREAGISATPLEQTVDAFVVCCQAAVYPDDPRLRVAAERFAAVIDIDYYYSVSQLCLHVVDPATGKLVDADEARWRLADHIGSLVGQLRRSGAVTRHGILRDGRPASALDDEAEPA